MVGCKFSAQKLLARQERRSGKIALSRSISIIYMKGFWPSNNPSIFFGNAYSSKLNVVELSVTALELLQ